MNGRRAFLRRCGGFFLCLAVFAGSGCQAIREGMALPAGKAFVPSNFYQAGPLPVTVKRVGVLPFYAPDWPQLSFSQMQAIFRSELDATGRFEVVPITSALLASKFGKERFGSTQELPHDFLPTLAEADGVDALMFIDITHYSPYEPISLGVRAKLVDVRTATVLWSFDTVFDSSDPSVAIAAQRFQKAASSEPYPLNSAVSVLQSPLRFSKYVADAVFKTLPER